MHGSPASKSRSSRDERTQWLAVHDTKIRERAHGALQHPSEPHSWTLGQRAGVRGCAKIFTVSLFGALFGALFELSWSWS